MKYRETLNKTGGFLFTLSALVFLNLSFLTGVQGQETAPPDLLRARLADLNKQSADLAVQISALDEFLGTADARMEALENSITELQTMSDTLSDINKKNLIKVIFQLAFETYSTIDKTTGIAKSGAESVANYGISYAAGRLAFIETGEATRKAMGLDENSYYSPRCASIQRLTEEAFNQSAEIAKVYWALDKDIAYYRALKLQETDADPGERGAIFYKNEVVREKIAGAIEAIRSLISTIDSQKTQAQNDRDWLEGEGASLAGLITGVEMQLEESLEERRLIELEEKTDALLDERVPLETLPGFTFRGFYEDESELSYYTARYNAGVAAIDAILDPVIPALNALWEDYEEAYTTVSEDFGIWNGKYAGLINYWSTKSHMTQSDFSGLVYTLGDLHITDDTIEKLTDARNELQDLFSDFEEADSGFVTFNNLKAQTDGVYQLADSSAFFSISYPEGEEPPEILGWYTMDKYIASKSYGPSWGYENFGSISQPMLFEDYYSTLYTLDSWFEVIDAAMANAQKARSAYGSHYTDLQTAINRVTSLERSQVDDLEGATYRMMDVLGRAEALTADKPFCPEQGDLYYNKLHKHYWTKAGLSDALEAAIVDNDRAEPVRELWQSYLEMVPTYEGLNREYEMAVSYARSVQTRISGNPPTFLSEVESAVALAEELGYPIPGNSISEMKTLENNYWVSRSFMTPANSFENARKLPAVHLLEDLDDTILPEMEQPFLNHPIAMELPVFGLLLIKEHMDELFDELMEMNARDETLMWDYYYRIVHEVDAWKAGQTDGIFGGLLFPTANKIRGEQLYAKRQVWEAAFGVPNIVAQSANTAVPPGTSVTLWVNATSKAGLSYTWYRDSWVQDDYVVGHGSSITLPSPTGLELYYCVVESINGTAYSGKIEIWPAKPPELAFQPQSVHVVAGQPTQLTASFYLTTSASVAQDAAWYVSDGPAMDSKFRRIPDSASNVLKLRSALATRFYYYEVTNPWGTTRTETVGVYVTTNEDYPVLIPPPDGLLGYTNKLFSYAFTGTNIDSFEWLAPAGMTGLEFDAGNGVISGILTVAPSTIVSLQVRALRQWGNQTLYSDWMPMSFMVMPENDYRPTMAERYFSGEQLLDESISGPFADPDHDGVVNLLEYAFGSAPNVKELARNPLPVFEINGDRARISFEKPVSPSGFYYVVEYSFDLRNWIPIKSIEGNCIDNGNGRESVVYQTPSMDAANRRILMRVRVVQL